MADTVELRLTRTFYKKAQGRYGKYRFQVGILEDKVHKYPKAKSDGLKRFAGGPARKIGSKSDKKMSDVSAEMRGRIGNFYKKPFTDPRNKDIRKFARYFMKMAGSGIGSTNRLRNLVQAIVRNPILRGDYGRNSKAWANVKGFNRLMIDTGQLFNNIKAKITGASTSVRN